MTLAIDFLQDHDGPITCYQLSPEPELARDEGILYIPSGPWDSMRLSWVHRQLLEQLRRLGYHVYRFDLQGTGDSINSSDEARWDRWIQESCLIRDALRQKVRKVHVLGFRLGAALALKTCESYAYRSIHLVDPVIYGQDYWASLQELQGKFLAEQNRYGSTFEAPDELFSFPLGLEWKNALNGLDLSQFNGKGRRASVYTSCAHPSHETFLKHLQSNNWELKQFQVKDDFAWTDFYKLHMQFFGRETMEAIVHAFTEL